MRRNVLVALLVASFALLSLACESGPTPATPTTSPPTATPAPTETATAPTHTPPVPPTASPTPAAQPLTGPIDLGVPAGDAYGPRAMAVDGARGRVYVVNSYGDTPETPTDPDAEPGTHGVLSVVDVAQGEVVATAALPRPFRTDTWLALAPAGDRLFIAGGDDNVLLVVATGAGDAPLGDVLSTHSDVRAVVLDATAGRLYAVGRGQLRVFDADTIEELQSAPLPDAMAQPSGSVLLAVSAEAGRLYLGAKNSELLTVYRTDTLERVADVLPPGRPDEIVASADGRQAYVLTLIPPDSVPQVAVMESEQVAQVWESAEGFRIRKVVAGDDPDRGFVWETADDGTSQLRAVNPNSGETLATVELPTASITQALVDRGRLHVVTWDAMYFAVALDAGAVEPAVSLGVTLRDALVDHQRGRLFVADSTGTIHVLDAVSLRKIDTWPRVAGAAPAALYAVPLSMVEGRLFVPNFEADETIVLDAATGERAGALPKAGQITFDPTHNRLFVTRQGVFTVDAETFAVTGSIEETLRKSSFSGEPSAMAARYDAAHDRLFVTMTNNVPGSSASTWLQIHDGETLQRVETGIEADQQFLSGLAVDAEAGRVYVASSFPGSDVAVFTVQGDLLTQLRHLSGSLFLDAADGRLHVAGWGGLVTLDTASHDVIGYRRLAPQYSEFTAIDVVNERLYQTRSNSADLIVNFLDRPAQVTVQTTQQMPDSRIQDLAVAAGGAVFATSETEGAYRRSDGAWQRMDTGLPPTQPPALHPAPGIPNVVFAYQEQREPYGQAYGIFRSADAGRTWTPAMRGLKTFAIRDLALSPNFATDQTAFALAGDAGLFRTTDGGATWERLSDVAGQAIALAPDASGGLALLTLATQPDVYTEWQVFAFDAGGSLDQISTIDAETYGEGALALSPNFAQDGTAIAGLYRAGLFLSQNFGHTWHQLPPRSEAFNPTYAIHFSPNFASDRMVYALIAPSYFGPEDRSRLYRSTDGGETWQQAADTEPSISTLAMGPDGALWAGTANGTVEPLAPDRLTWEDARAPTPTPVPTPAEPPAGFYRPQGTFADVWVSDPDVRQALGWAAEPAPEQVSTAFQRFEGGAMIWRDDTRTVYALYDDGTWSLFEDTWTPDEPASDPSLQPPSGREQPVRGFGKVWREQPGVRDRLGWALAPEQGDTSPVQTFERGTAIGVASSVYALTREAGEPATWLSR